MASLICLISSVVRGSEFSTSFVARSNKMQLLFIDPLGPITDRPASSYVVTNETSALCGVNALKRIVAIDQLILHAITSEAFPLGPGSADRMFGGKQRGGIKPQERASSGLRLPLAIEQFQP